MAIKFIGALLLSAAAGSTGKEAATGGVVALAGTFATAYLGGWDKALSFLVWAMAIDYVSGLLGAIKTKSVNSEVMFWGGIRKAIVLLVVFLAVQLDQFIGGQAPVFRTLALYFYIGREGLSVIENIGVLGVPMPAAMKNTLEQLKQKGESDNGKGV